MTLTNEERLEPVEVEDIRVVAETEAAIKVVQDDDPDEDGFWIPKSQVRDESEVYSLKSTKDGPGKLVIPRWLAEEKGLV